MPLCLTKSHEVPKLYARGVCKSCYDNLCSKVYRAKTTWQILEAADLVLPSHEKDATTPLARTLRFYRKNLSGRTVAKEIDVSKSTYYNWEDSMNPTMSLEEMLAFCKVVGVDWKDFVTTYICNRD